MIFLVFENVFLLICWNIGRLFGLLRFLIGFCFDVLIRLLFIEIVLIGVLLIMLFLKKVFWDCFWKSGVMFDFEFCLVGLVIRWFVMVLIWFLFLKFLEGSFLYGDWLSFDLEVILKDVCGIKFVFVGIFNERVFDFEFRIDLILFNDFGFVRGM